MVVPGTATSNGHTVATRIMAGTPPTGAGGTGTGGTQPGRTGTGQAPTRTTSN